MQAVMANVAGSTARKSETASQARTVGTALMTIGATIAERMKQMATSANPMTTRDSLIKIMTLVIVNAEPRDKPALEQFARKSGLMLSTKEK